MQKSDMLSLSWNAWQLPGPSRSAISSSLVGHFTVVSDHNPLIPILSLHRLDKIENRCLHVKHRSWVAISLPNGQGCKKRNEAAYALFHHPYQQPADGYDLADHKTDTHHSQAAKNSNMHQPCCHPNRRTYTSRNSDTTLSNLD